MIERSLVSIFVPSYNHAQFLRASLDSALAQTYRPIEIVVVDDGSDDESLAIAESYAAEHPSLIRVFTHPGRSNRGISATVNAAIRASSGKYLAGLASDDVFYPDKTEQQVTYLESHPDKGWVYSAAHWIDAQGRPSAPTSLVEDINDRADPIASLLNTCLIFTPSVLARRDCFDKTGNFDESLIFSDWDYWIRMLVRFKVGFIEKPLMQYRVHGRNTSAYTDPSLAYERSLRVLAAIRRKLPSLVEGGEALRLRRLVDESLDRYAFDRYYNLTQSGRRLAAVQVLREAFRTAPDRALRPRRILSIAKHFVWPQGGTITIGG